MDYGKNLAIASVLALFFAYWGASADERTIEFNKSNQAIFIFGVRSNVSTYGVIFYPLKSVTEVTYKSTLFTPARFTGSPTNGYIVGTAKAGESVGLMSVRIGFTEPSLSGYTMQFDICEQTPTGTVRAGEVVYFGDIDIHFNPTSRDLYLKSTHDVEAATTYLSIFHPELSPLMTTQEMTLRNRVGKCYAPK